MSEEEIFIEISTRIATLIKQKLKEKKWERIEFAERMGVAPSVVTRWLSGENNFTLRTIWRMQIVLETQIIYIIKH